jgi:NAD kinase
MNARAGAWMSYDAQPSVEIERGSYIKLTSAAIPMPTLNHFDLDGDWFASIRDKLHWNLRLLQTPQSPSAASHEAENPS